MQTSKAIIKKANIYPRLRLFVKTEKGLNSTGRHLIKLLADKEIKGNDYMTSKEIEKVRYLVEEKGEKKIFERKKYNKSGDIDYLIIKMAEFNEGDEVVIEGKKAGIKNVVSISSVSSSHSVETEEEEGELSDVIEDIEL